MPFVARSAVPLVIVSIVEFVIINIGNRFSVNSALRRVAKKSPENLPTFYTAVSGFRLLMALGVMLVYYLINGGDTMLVFFLVFMVFYFASLIHHSVFFARVSNRL